MEPLVLFGAGGHAVVIQELIQMDGRFDVAAIVLDPKYIQSCRNEFAKLPRFSADEIPALRSRGYKHACVAVGDNRARVAAAGMFRAAGFECVNLIHPSAVVSPSARIGSGVAILAGAHLGAVSSLGDDVILNSASSVDHDCAIESGVHICPGVTVAGKVKIGKNTWIGVGATVSDLVRIGADTLVGAGSVVVKNLPDGVVAYGVPARVIRNNSPKE